MLDNYVNIIIVGYDLLNEELDCIRSVIERTKHPYIINYINNYSSGFSLTQVWNELISNSPTDYICLLNNDTIVYPSWLSKLVQTLQNDADIACISPSTNNCHSPQKNIPTPEEAQQHENEVEIMKDPISGFCLLFRKSLWEQIGGFDERFPFYGQESLFQWRAQQLGYKLAWRKDAFVYHIGEQSIKKSDMNVEQERKKAVDLYWSIVRGDKE